MICIDKELIKHELQQDVDKGFVFTHKKLSNRFLDWLFRHYYTVESCINSYDSEPVNYDEWSELKSTSEGRMKLKQLYRDYEPERIKHCNWQDPSAVGIWGMTQKQVDEEAKQMLKQIRNVSTSKKERIYYAKKDDMIWIYVYTRDIIEQDYWFIMHKK